MELAGLPMSVLFVLFLTLFVVIGIYPAVKRTLARLRQLLQPGTNEGGAWGAWSEAEEASLAPAAPALNDFEIMVLRCLAQSDRGLTRKQIDAELFLGKETVRQALESLLRRGLVDLVVVNLISLRFYLSEQGRIYAVAHEYLPQLHSDDATENIQ